MRKSFVEERLSLPLIFHSLSISLAFSSGFNLSIKMLFIRILLAVEDLRNDESVKKISCSIYLH